MTALQAPKFKTPVKVLAILALSFSLLYSITYFISYHFDWGSNYPRLVFRLPRFRDLISMQFNLIPCIMLFLCAVFLYGKRIGRLFVPLIWCVLAAKEFYWLAYDLIQGYTPLWWDLLFSVTLLAGYILCAIFGFSRNPKKIFTIITAAVSLSVKLIYSFSDLSYYFEKYMYMYLFTNIMSLSKNFSLFAAMLLLTLSHRSFTQPEA